jgi:hypothetical protein
MRALRGSGVVTGTHNPSFDRAPSASGKTTTYWVRNFSSLDEIVGETLSFCDALTQSQTCKKIGLSFTRFPEVSTILQSAIDTKPGAPPTSEAIIISRPEFRPMLCLCRRFRFQRSRTDSTN